MNSWSNGKKKTWDKNCSWKQQANGNVAKNIPLLYGFRQQSNHNDYSATIKTCCRARGQWSVVSVMASGCWARGQWSVVSGQQSAVSGQCDG